MASSGNVTDEAWKEYIKNQKPPELDDDFTVIRRSSAEVPIDPAFSGNPKPPALAGGVFTLDLTVIRLSVTERQA